jgi:transposase InsO family protein
MRTTTPRRLLARRVKKSSSHVEVVSLLAARNYKVSATVGVTTVVATPVIAILDTGAGPNLIRADLLPDDWERYRVVGTPERRIVGAGGRQLAQKGVVNMHVCMGRLKVQTRFIVVERLVAECIVGCQFIDRHVKTILPMEKRVILSDGSIVPILRTAEPPPQKGQPKPPPELPPSTKVRVAKFVVLPPRSECQITVQCAAPGLRFLQARLRKEAGGIHMANGVADILPNRPFVVRVINASTREQRLPKGMVLGNALPHPTGMVALIEDPDTVVLPSKERNEGSNRETVEEANAWEKEPPPLPDRPDVEGDSWKEAVQLGHLTVEQRESILQMLAKHRSMWNGRLGHVHSTSHRIDLLPGSRPVHCQPYRAGPRAREIGLAEIQRMLDAGVIERATSEWASPIVLVAKPDGSTRFCVDYRRLNAITVRDSYPLPRMDDCIDSLGDARVFSTLDCNSGYWQIPVRPEDREKTTFTSHDGLYWFLRMPFGLRNAPATFQRFVDITLSGLTWKSCLVYLDDIIVFSRTPEEHMKHLDAVLHRLYRAGLTLNLKKCHFFKDKVDYLGHVIRPGQLSVAEKNTEALKKAKHPTTQTELRSFLGLCNVYRRFVKGFAKIAAPLNVLLRKGEKTVLDVLTEEQAKAFETLRTALLNPPILALPRLEGMFTLDTDASDTQLGCCLLQKQPDGKDLPVGYWSRGLTPAERNYSTTEKECLAIVWSVLHLRPYLEGKRFLIRTDHHSLRWILNLSDAQGRLARWRLRLSEFDYEVQHTPGAGHHGADVMSRLQSEKKEIAEPSEPVDVDVPCFVIEDTPDPSLILPDFVRNSQLAHFHTHPVLTGFGADPSIDMDNHGLIGVVRHTGEFELVIPPVDCPLPLSIVTEAPVYPGSGESISDGDALDLRRGEVLSRSHISLPGPGPLSSTLPPVLAQILTEFSDLEVYPVDDLPQMIQQEELKRAQEEDSECRALFQSETPNSIIDVNAQGVLIRKAPMDGSEQILVPQVLRPRLLHLEHYPASAGHPGVSRMYSSMRRRYFWKDMYRDVESTVRHCTVCAKNRIGERKRTSYLKLFPAEGPLEYVAMDILGPLPKTEHGNRFLLVISDRFSKLTRTVPLRTISALVVAKAFCDHWVFAYGPPTYLLTDQGTQFNAKFFLAVCRELGITKVFTSAYHPQTNGQVERYNRTILNALRGYVTERQNDWDEYTSAITFGYNCRVHSSLNFAPFELVLSRPPTPLSVETPRSLSQETPATAKLRFLQQLKELIPLARRRAAEAQGRYKDGFDDRVREKNKGLAPGSWVFLRREVHADGVSPKLDDQVDGPYRILDTDGQVFRLRIGDDDVRVSSDRITPAPSGPEPGEGTTGKELPQEPSVEEEYVFEKIVGTREARDGTLRYRVRWYGYSREDDTWEPGEHLPMDALRRYHRRVGLPAPPERS